MPEIPQLQTPSGLDYNAPAQIAGVDSAGLIGEGFQRTGNALIGLSDTLSRLDEAKTSARRTLDEQQAHSRGKSEGIDLYYDTLKNGKEDGSNWVESFKKEYDRRSSLIQKDYQGDTLTQEGVATRLRDVRNELVSNLSHASQLKSTEYLNRLEQQSVDGAVQNIYKSDNPIGTYDQESAQLNKTFTDLVGTQFRDKNTAMLESHKAHQQMADIVMTKLVEQGQFDTAKSMLHDKFSGVFNEKELTDRSRKLFLYQNEATARVIQEYNREESSKKKIVEKDQKQNASVIKQLAYDADTPDKQAQAMQVAEKAFSNDGISREQLNGVKELVKDKNKVVDDSLAVFQIEKELTKDSYDSDKMRDLIQKQVEVTKTLSPKSGSRLLRQVESDSSALQRDPFDTEKRRYMNNKIGEAFGIPDPTGGNKFIFPGDSKTQANEASKQILRLVEGGMDRIQATDKYLEPLRKAAASRGPLMVPGIPAEFQNDPNSLQEGMKSLVIRYKSGGSKLTDKEMSEATRVYKQKIQTFKINEKKK